MTKIPIWKNVPMSGNRSLLPEVREALDTVASRLYDLQEQLDPGLGAAIEWVDTTPRMKEFYYLLIDDLVQYKYEWSVLLRHANDLT